MTYYAMYNGKDKKYYAKIVFSEKEYEQMPRYYTNLVTSGSTLYDAFKELAYECYRLWHHFNTYDKVKVDILRKARRDIYIMLK